MQSKITRTVLSLVIVCFLFSSLANASQPGPILEKITQDQMVMAELVGNYDFTRDVNDSMRESVKGLLDKSKRYYQDMLEVDLGEEYSEQYRDLLLVASNWQAVMEMYWREFQKDDIDVSKVKGITEVALEYHVWLTEEVIKASTVG